MAKTVPEPQKLAASDARQGTVVSARVKNPNISATSEVVTITPTKFKVGDVLELGGTDYPITTITQSTLKSNSGSALSQKAATIQLPETTNEPVKKYSFLIVKSF